ncbi:hypothetical protein [Xanthomonas hortorum]|uniref:hypothetical protein n=1 Tax=Xanthomonas hortorum TaxID=56454 RepID=UPI002935745E|nr:hypothetical protein [Xanthomonas hortorum]MDV2450129.1 hypothetical protein [Xanthomonas hortorum NBC5720]
MQANDLLALVVSCGLAGVLTLQIKIYKQTDIGVTQTGTTDRLTIEISPNNSIKQIFCCG